MEKVTQIDRLKNLLLDQVLLLAILVSTITYLISLNGIGIRGYDIYFFLDLGIIVIFIFTYLKRKSISITVKVLVVLFALSAFLISNTIKHGVFAYLSILVIVPFFSQLAFSVKKSISIFVILIALMGFIGFLILSGSIEITSDPAVRMSEPLVWITRLILLSVLGFAILLLTYRFNKTFLELIGDLKTKNKDLKIRQANLHSIVESNNHLIGQFDKEKKLVQFNSAFAEFAMQANNIEVKKGLMIGAFLSPHNAELFNTGLETSLAGEKVNTTFELDISSGKIIYLVNFNPIIGDEGTIGTVVFAQDITKLKQAQYELKLYSEKLEMLVEQRTQELKNANKTLEMKHIALQEKSAEIQDTLRQLKETQDQLIETEKMASLGVLISGIGHEINNPLNFIKGGVLAIKNQLNEVNKNEENLQQFIEIIEDGVERASRIVKNLKTFSQSKEQFNDTCEIHDLIDESVEYLSDKIHSGIQLIKNYHTEKVSISGNKGKLKQAIINLMSNACYAIEKEGQIELKTFVGNGKVEISIRDTGTGIKPDLLNKISDPFYTTKPPGEGTGLGLSITNKIAKEHSGIIKMSSKWGEGSIFTLELPVFNGK